MARSIPPDRFARLIEAATRIFIAHGYRQAQMADVATALGVAKGTIYGYVESKDALFDAAVRYADRLEAPPASSSFPLKTPVPGRTIAYVQERLAAEAADLALVRFATSSEVTPDPAEEISLVVSGLYRALSKNRMALKLVDRSAAEYPELADVWFGQGRWAQHELLVRLLDSRIALGRYRPVSSTAIAARSVLELVAFWAVHRHFDPAPQVVDEKDVEQTLIELISRSLLEDKR